MLVRTHAYVTLAVQNTYMLMHELRGEPTTGSSRVRTVTRIKTEIGLFSGNNAMFVW